jgi:hypothetical protein
MENERGEIVDLYVLFHEFLPHFDHAVFHAAT